jgi:ribose transport system permease protein
LAVLVRRYGTLCGFLVVVVFFALSLPDTFLTGRNWLNITVQVSMLTVVAVAMTIVMVMGDFDLSVGSMASLSGVIAAVLFVRGWPVAPAAALALLAGLAGGAVNGVLVSLVGILPFIATLATLTIFSGAAFLLSGGKTIFGRDIPAAFSDFARAGLPLGDIGGQALKLPYLTVVAMVVVAVVWLLLEQTIFGRRLYAIGGNREAARLAGVRVSACASSPSRSLGSARRLPASCMRAASPRPIRRKAAASCSTPSPRSFSA